MELSKELLIRTIEKCLENAQELFDEAEILRAHKKFPRAYTLFHLSIEEIGKIFLTYRFFVRNEYSESAIKNFEKEFTSHKVKLDYSANIDIIAKWLLDGAGDFDPEIIKSLKYSKEKINSLNDNKNYSLYTFFKDKSVFKPSDIIESEEIDAAAITAKMRLVGTKSFCNAFLSEIDKIIEIAAQSK